MEFYLGGMTDIVAAVWSADAWMLQQAFSHPSIYLLAALLVIPASLLIMVLFKAIPPLDRHVESSVLVLTYLTIAAIIFVEVIRRFVFQLQAPWSTTLPPLLFLIMTWFGCAYNVKLRAHLAFTEVRQNLPLTGQFFCAVIDAVLWIGFGVIVIVTTLRQTVSSAANFQILLGTDNVMQWWFYILVPVSWLILTARVVENLIDDYRNYRAGNPLFNNLAPISE